MNCFAPDGRLHFMLETAFTGGSIGWTFANSIHGGNDGMQSTRSAGLEAAHHRGVP
jgi:hypothetical protein